MTRPFIVTGDSTSHGGTVIGGATTTDTNGARIARVGDKVTCPRKGHGRETVISAIQQSSSTADRRLDMEM